MSNFINLIYTFKNMPERRKYILERLEKIYPTTSKKELNEVLDEIKIKFRDQEERGASNHKVKTIYVPLKDIKRFDLNNKDDVFKYLENPKSPIVHETMHIFQNLAGAFPDVDYLEKQPSGKLKINHEKYISDLGEKQSRLEQVLELLNWGFTKSEIINWLYNRQYNDKAMWSKLIDNVVKLKKEKTL
jgi:hypothetical protein